MDTGHTTAHLTYVTDVRLHELAEIFGKRNRRFSFVYTEKQTYVDVFAGIGRLPIFAVEFTGGYYG
jgi:hypothetical protein